MIGRMSRAAVLLAGLLLPFPAMAQSVGMAEFAIKGMDGTPVANHRLSREQAAQVESLKNVAVAGNPKGDVTVHQFYDLNCPYCRRASSDVLDLLRSDKNLRVVFVPYAVLSVASIQAAMVELQIIDMAPQRFTEFHRKIYAGRGTIDGARALAVAKEMGFDPEAIVARANTPRTPEILKAHATLGGDLKLMATPAYVVKGVAIVGHPGKASLQGVVRAVRKCGQVVC
jgi:protein-disulfide isomerase